MPESHVFVKKENVSKYEDRLSGPFAVMLEWVFYIRIVTTFAMS
jgi:hypothetical protein